MMLTRNAIGNLINRYRAVLSKCRLLNTFGSLVVATALTLGGAGMAWGDDLGDVVLENGQTRIVDGFDTANSVIVRDSGSSMTVESMLGVQNGITLERGGSFTNTGATVANGGNVSIEGNSSLTNTNSLTLKNGNINLAGDATLTNSGSLRLQNGGIQTEAGTTITNDGSIVLTGDSSILGTINAGTGSQISIASTLTVSAQQLDNLRAGQIVIDGSGGGNAALRFTNATDTLSFQNTDFVSGAFVFKGTNGLVSAQDGTMAIEGDTLAFGNAAEGNSGTVVANSFTLKPSGNEVFLTNGTMNAVGTGSVIDIQDGSAQGVKGTLVVDGGNLILGGGRQEGDNSAPVDAGTIKGSLALAGRKDNEFEIKSGTWDVQGDIEGKTYGVGNLSVLNGSTLTAGCIIDVGNVSVLDGSTLTAVGILGVAKVDAGGNITVGGDFDTETLTVSNGATVKSETGNISVDNQITTGDGTLEVNGNMGISLSGGANDSRLNIVATNGTVAIGGITSVVGDITADYLSVLASNKLQANAVNAGTLAVNNKTLEVANDVTATDAYIRNNGKIQSTGGSIAIVNQLQNADGTLQASKDVTLTNGAANSGNLSIVAGDTATIGATSTIGSVDADTLKVTGGTLTAGTATANKIQASNGATIDANAVAVKDTSTDRFREINADRGSITSSSLTGIKGTDLKANGATGLIEGTSVDATSATLTDGGTIRATTGDITVASQISNGDGKLEATAGNITLTNGAVNSDALAIVAGDTATIGATSTIGSVDADTLRVTGGTLTVGTATANKIQAGSGATLDANAVAVKDTTTDRFREIFADGGTITSNTLIKGTDLKADGAFGLIEGTSVDATSAQLTNGGTIRATTGNLTVTDQITNGNGNGTLEATAGDVTLTNGANDSQLNIVAAAGAAKIGGATSVVGDITAATLDVTATNKLQANAVNASTLKVDNNTLEVANDVTATDATILNSGTIKSTGGSITISNQLQNANGTLGADENVTLTNGAATSGNLTIVAGGTASFGGNSDVHSVTADTLEVTGGTFSADSATANNLHAKNGTTLSADSVSVKDYTTFNEVFAENGTIQSDSALEGTNLKATGASGLIKGASIAADNATLETGAKIQSTTGNISIANAMDNANGTLEGAQDVTLSQGATSSDNLTVIAGGKASFGGDSDVHSVTADSLEVTGGTFSADSATANNLYAKNGTTLSAENIAVRDGTKFNEVFAENGTIDVGDPYYTGSSNTLTAANLKATGTSGLIKADNIEADNVTLEGGGTLQAHDITIVNAMNNAEGTIITGQNTQFEHGATGHLTVIAGNKAAFFAGNSTVDSITAESLNLFEDLDTHTSYNVTVNYVTANVIYAQNGTELSATNITVKNHDSLYRIIDAENGIIKTAGSLEGTNLRATGTSGLIEAEKIAVGDVTLQTGAKIHATGGDITIANAMDNANGTIEGAWDVTLSQGATNSDNLTIIAGRKASFGGDSDVHSVTADTLEVTGGTFSADSATANNLHATNGTTLSADSVSVRDGTKFNDVFAENGTIKSDSALEGTNLKATGASGLIKGASIAADNATLESGGRIQAVTGPITIANQITTGNGTLEATAGDVTLTSGANDSQLNIVAANGAVNIGGATNVVGDITATTLDVTASDKLQANAVNANTLKVNNNTLEVTNDVSATDATILNGGTIHSTGGSIAIGNQLQNADGTLQADENVTLAKGAATSGNLTIIAGGKASFGDNSDVHSVTADTLEVTGGTFSADSATANNLHATNGTTLSADNVSVKDGTKFNEVFAENGVIQSGSALEGTNLKATGASGLIKGASIAADNATLETGAKIQSTTGNITIANAMNNANGTLEGAQDVTLSQGAASSDNLTIIAGGKASFGGDSDVHSVTADTLEVTGGTFSADSATANNLHAKNGTTLSADSVSVKDGTKFNEVFAENGTIKSDSALEGTNFKATGASGLIKGASIAADNATLETGGRIQAVTGPITIATQITSGNGTLEATAGDVTLTNGANDAQLNIVAANGAVNIGGATNVVGDITAATLDVTASDKLQANAVNANTLKVNNNTLEVTNDVSATDTTILNGGTIHSTGGSITISNQLQNADGTLQADENVTLTKGAANSGNLTIIAGGKASFGDNSDVHSVSADTLEVTGGTFSADSATANNLHAQNGTTLSADSVSAKDGTKFNEVFAENGTIKSESALESTNLKATGASGLIKGASIAADNATLETGAKIQSTTGNITIANAINNANGTLEGAQDVTLSQGAASSDNLTIIAGGKASFGGDSDVHSVTADTLEVTGGTFSADSATANNLHATNGTTLSADSVSVRDGSKFNGVFAENGTIKSDSALEGTNLKATGASGLIKGASITADNATLETGGRIQAVTGPITIATQITSGNGALEATAGNITLTNGADDSQLDIVAANGAVNIGGTTSVVGDITADRLTVQTANKLQANSVDANTLEVDGKNLEVTNGIDTDTVILDNAGSIKSTTGDITIANAMNNANGTIEGAQDVTLSKGATNSGNLTIKAGGTASFGGNSDVHSVTADTLEITGGTFSADDAAANNLHATNGTTLSADRVSVKDGTKFNDVFAENGTIKSDSALEGTNLKATGASGLIKGASIAADNATLETGGRIQAVTGPITIANQITTGNGTLEATAGDITLTNGANASQLDIVAANGAVNIGGTTSVVKDITADRLTVQTANKLQANSVDANTLEVDGKSLEVTNGLDTDTVILDNAGSIKSTTGSVTIANAMNNANGTIEGAQDVTLSQGATNSDNLTIKAGGTASFGGNSDIHSVTADTLEVTGGTFSADSATANNLHAANGTTLSADRVSVKDGTTFNEVFAENGTIKSDSALEGTNLKATGASGLIKGASIAADNATLETGAKIQSTTGNITIANAMDNANGTLEGAQDVTLSKGATRSDNLTIIAGGKASFGGNSDVHSVTADTLEVTGGTFSADDATANNLHAKNGTTLSADSLSVNDGTKFNEVFAENGSTIVSSSINPIQATHIKAGVLGDTVASSISGNGITADKLELHAGSTITATGGDLIVTTDAVSNANGTLVANTGNINLQAGVVSSPNLTIEAKNRTAGAGEVTIGGNGNNEIGTVDANKISVSQGSLVADVVKSAGDVLMNGANQALTAVRELVGTLGAADDTVTVGNGSDTATIDLAGNSTAGTLTLNKVSGDLGDKLVATNNITASNGSSVSGGDIEAGNMIKAAGNSSITGNAIKATWLNADGQQSKIMGSGDVEATTMTADAGAISGATVKATTVNLANGGTVSATNGNLVVTNTVSGADGSLTLTDTNTSGTIDLQKGATSPNLRVQAVNGAVSFGGADVASNVQSVEANTLDVNGKSLIVADTVTADTINLFGEDTVNKLTSLVADAVDAAIINLKDSALTAYDRLTGKLVDGGNGKSDVTVGDGSNSATIDLAGNNTVGRLTLDKVSGDLGDTLVATNNITASNGSSVTGGDIEAGNMIKATGNSSITGNAIKATWLNADGQQSKIMGSGAVEATTMTADAGAIGGASVKASTINLANGGTVTATNGDLVVTNTVSGADGSLTLADNNTGTIDVQKGATSPNLRVQAVNGAVSFGGTDVDSTVKSVSAQNVEVNGKSLTTETLNRGNSAGATTVADNGILRVTGANDGDFAGALNVGNASLAAGAMPTSRAFIYNPGAMNDTAKTMTVANATINVNPGGLVALGYDVTAPDAENKFVLNMQESMSRATKVGGAPSAVLYLDRPTVVASSASVGVGTAAPAAGNVAFDDKTLLVVNGDNGSATTPYLSASGTISGLDKASLDVQHMSVNQNIKLLDAGAAQSTDFGNGKNVTTDNLLVNASYANGVISTSQIKAEQALPGLDGKLGALIDRIIGQILQGENSSQGGIKFLARAMNKNFGGQNPAEAAKAVEGAARSLAVAAVPQMAMSANTAGVNAVTQRTSMTTPTSPLQGMDASGQTSGLNSGDETGLSAGNEYNKTGFGMWIMPLWQSSNGFGLKAGNYKMDYSGNVAGVALGADYTIEDTVRAGVTFNIGGGHSSGSGDFGETTNNMNFWGVGAYVGMVADELGLTADVNYTSSFNAIKQELPSSFAMGNLNGEVRSSAISAGLRAEYKFETEALDIIPHVAARYTALHSDAFSMKSGGQSVMKTKATDQNLWSFPVGVTFAKKVDTGNGWYVKPSLDLTVTPTTGDVDNRQKIQFTGLANKATMESQVMDRVTYGGQAGVEFGNDAIQLGLNYNLQVGEHTTNHGVFGTFRYNF